MKKLLLWAIIIGIMAIQPSMLFAEAGQRFEVDGYSLHISATRLSKKLIVTGKVSGGEGCEILKIYCNLVDENSKTDRVIAVIENYSYSRKFSLKKRLRCKGGNRWIVSDVRISK